MKPRDVIAIILIIGGMAMMCLGIDHIVAGILIAIVAFYFGWQTPKPKDADEAIGSKKEIK